jgi:hypothetical protein
MGKGVQNLKLRKWAPLYMWGRLTGVVLHKYQVHSLITSKS